MTEVLLKELNNSDIDWMIATGTREEIAAGEVLLQESQSTSNLYLILEGTLTIAVPQAESDPLAAAFSALEGRETTEREIARLSSGELVGEECFLDSRSPATIVRALENSLVLSIPQAQLTQKLQQDVSFAAHFYRAIAILLSNRLRSVVSQLGYRKLAQSSQIREVLFVFGELNDSDIDWIIAAGQREKVPSGTILIHKGRPVDGLYILLNGTMTVSVSDDEANPLAVVFASLDGSESEDISDSSRDIARLLRGDILGEMPFVDDRPPETTVKAAEDSLVLMVPKQQLVVKLNQDVVFASHFYRVIAILLLNRLRDITSRLGYGRRTYEEGQALDERIEYTDELDFDILDHVSLAGARFDWLLKRLNVKGT
ncbi:MAG: cyclic nucleotide-binding domain-containing protein [Leptolyngbyaceae cyanobacterium RU_5_1]|nr:cyclic nucleotide-binding domain-containing protein [Leptolyngbyaceae cyanobacterium RU_5_1]